MKKFIYYELGLVLILLLLNGYTFLKLNNEKSSYNQDELKTIIEANKLDTHTKTIYNKCLNYTTLDLKMKCVNQFVKSNFIYKETNLVYTSDDLFESGGDCKSYTMLYITLANMFGYDYAYIKTTNHVLAFIYNKHFYCTTDQQYISCVSLE